MEKGQKFIEGEMEGRLIKVHGLRSLLLATRAARADKLKQMIKQKVGIVAHSNRNRDRMPC